MLRGSVTSSKVAKMLDSQIQFVDTKSDCIKGLNKSII